MIQKNEKGFSALEVVLVLVIVALVGFVGWYVYSASKNTNNTYSSSSKISSGSSPKFSKNHSNSVASNQSTCSTDAAVISKQGSDFAHGCKFSGTVTVDECATSSLPTGDVGCSVTVGKNLVYVMHGNAVTTEPWGTFNLEDVTVGKHVQVFAHQTDPTTFTLEGSNSYYVKAVE